MATIPSNPSPAVTVSIESAMTSLDTREYLIPGVPMDIPSDTVMVLKIMDLPPALFAPAAPCLASWSMCMLQGVTMLQVDAIPTTGFLKSLSVKPTALSMERLGALCAPST